MPNPVSLLQRLMMPEGLPQPPQAPQGRRPADALGGRVEGLPAGPPVHIEDPSGKLTGDFDRGVFHDVISKARMAGVDPATALAMAGQETTFGRYGGGANNPLHLLKHGLEDVYPGGDTLAALDYFKKRSSLFPNDEELGIQAYNGLGKIQGGSEVPDGEKMYGGQIELHGARDRPYGKRIIELRNMLLQQPAVKGLIK
jgi:hypothetical protein